MSQISVKYMPLDELPAWEKNPKKHAIDKLKASLNRFGFTQPVIIDEGTGKLVAGHGRVEALSELAKEGANPPKRVEVLEDGRWAIPVIRGVGFTDQKEADGYVVADNRTVELGGWDDELLHDLLQQFQGESEEYIQAVGYDLPDLEKLLADTTPAPRRQLQPAEVTEQFMNADIKQIVIYVDADEYEALLPRMAKLMDKFGVESHTELLLAMVDRFEDEDAG